MKDFRADPEIRPLYRKELFRLQTHAQLQKASSSGAVYVALQACLILSDADVRNISPAVNARMIGRENARDPCREPLRLMEIYKLAHHAPRAVPVSLSPQSTVRTGTWLALKKNPSPLPLLLLLRRRRRQSLVPLGKRARPMSCPRTTSPSYLQPSCSAPSWPRWIK